MDRADDTRERILGSAEQLLRRFGPAKTTVVDVARALGMSHGNVYRHFASKADLQDAVAERWLKGVSDPLEEIARSPGPAGERLERWLLALLAAKRRKVLDEPELFATFHALASAARGVVDHHVATLQSQVAQIIRDGVVAGEFRVGDAESAARAVLDATLRFHHPHHLLDQRGPPDEAAARRVVRLLVAGLQAGAI